MEYKIILKKFLWIFPSDKKFPLKRDAEIHGKKHVVCFRCQFFGNDLKLLS